MVSRALPISLANQNKDEVRFITRNQTSSFTLLKSDSPPQRPLLHSAALRTSLWSPSQILPFWQALTSPAGRASPAVDVSREKAHLRGSMVFRDTCLQSPCPCRGSILRARVLFNGSITENHGSLRSQLAVRKITASPYSSEGMPLILQDLAPIAEFP